MYAPSGGVVWRVSTFPPDSEWDAATQSGESLGGLGAAEALAADGDIPGMHSTETVDVVTIISGEIYAVLEDDETLLHPGDTIIQRGTKHTWNNRTDKPCVLVAAMIPALR
jgi:mannose-6-phosphate isomerase-like protein (cupin superfamily)